MKTTLTTLIVLTLAGTLFAQADSYRGRIPIIPSTGEPNYLANKAYQHTDHVVDVRDYMDGVSGRPTYATWAANQATTDVAAVIQAAVDAAEAAGGGKVFFPWTGDPYLIKSPIVIPEGSATISFEGAYSKGSGTYIKAADDWTGTGAVGDDAMFHFSSASGGQSYYKFFHLTLSANHQASHCIYGQKLNSLSIDDCIFYHADVSAVTVAEGWNCHIRNSWFVSNVDGIRISNAGNSFIVADCYITDGDGVGINCYGSAGMNHAVVVRDSIVENNAITGIYAGNLTNLTIDTCEMEGNGSTGWVITSPISATIKATVIVNADHIGDGMGTVSPAINVRYINNYVASETDAAAGLYCVCATNLTVEDNYEAGAGIPIVATYGNGDSAAPTNIFLRYNTTTDTTRVSDGTFDLAFDTGTPDNWAGANWAKSGTTALHSAGATTALTQAACTVLAGVEYQLTFDVVGGSAGTVTPSFGGVTLTARNFGNASYSEKAVATAATALAFTPSNDFDGALDNVVLTAVSNIQLAVEGGLAASDATKDMHKGHTWHIDTTQKVNYFPQDPTCWKEGNSGAGSTCTLSTGTYRGYPIIDLYDNDGSSNYYTYVLDIANDYPELLGKTVWFGVWYKYGTAASPVTTGFLLYTPNGNDDATERAGDGTWTFKSRVYQIAANATTCEFGFRKFGTDDAHIYMSHPMLCEIGTRYDEPMTLHDVAYLASNTSTTRTLQLKTVAKTIDLDDDASTDDYQFDDDAANTTEQVITLTNILPAYAELVGWQIRCFEGTTGVTTATAQFGTSSGGTELADEATACDDTGEVIGTVAGAGPILAATNAARSLYFSVTPSANWSDMASTGRWAVMITYIDYGEAYNRKNP